MLLLELAWHHCWSESGAQFPTCRRYTLPEVFDISAELPHRWDSQSRWRHHYG